MLGPAAQSFPFHIEACRRTHARHPRTVRKEWPGIQGQWLYSQLPLLLPARPGVVRLGDCSLLLAGSEMDSKPRLKVIRDGHSQIVTIVSPPRVISYVYNVTFLQWSTHTTHQELSMLLLLLTAQPAAGRDLCVQLYSHTQVSGTLHIWASNFVIIKMNGFWTFLPRNPNSGNRRRGSSLGPL